ncbi:MAG: hypothetical protein M0P95_17885 [Sulfuritalea sp.]|jgi:hypothetical protein|nr:hypothetical protein [Sulfuritalea sp.]
MNVTKHLLPGLSVQVAADGAWLCFDNARYHAAICLDNNLDPITGKAMKEWADSYRVLLAQQAKDHAAFTAVQT